MPLVNNKLAASGLTITIKDGQATLLIKRNGTEEARALPASIAKALVVVNGDYVGFVEPGKAYFKVMEGILKGNAGVQDYTRGLVNLNAQELEQALRGGYVKAIPVGTNQFGSFLYKYEVVGYNGLQGNLILGQDGSALMKKLGETLYSLPIAGPGSFRMVNAAELGTAKPEAVIYEGEMILAVSYQDGMTAKKFTINGKDYAFIGVPLSALENDLVFWQSGFARVNAPAAGSLNINLTKEDIAALVNGGWNYQGQAHRLTGELNAEQRWS